MIHIFGNRFSESQVMNSDVLNTYMIWPKILFLRALQSLQNLWFRTKLCLPANFKKEPFIQVDLLREHSFDNCAAAGLQSHSPLSRYPCALNKLHKRPNTWALYIPLSENVLRAVTPLAFIWPNFYTLAPAAPQNGSSFVNLLDHNPESDSQFYSLRKEIFVSTGDRSICFNPSHKVIKFITLTQEM